MLSKHKAHLIKDPSKKSSAISTSMLVLCSLLLLVAHPLSWALPDDRKQPINVSADRAEKDDKKGTTVYIGDVIMTQGSIRVTGATVTIYDNNGTVDKMIATGKQDQPATFKQKPDAASEDVIAEAQTLEYRLDNETLLLEGEALLKQEGRTTNSNKIIYDMKTTVVNAGANDGRVIMVIPPNTK